MSTGELYGSGTASGPGDDERGCLLELTWGGREPLRLPDGSSRAWLQDGDELAVRGSAPGTGGQRLDLGEVRARIEAAPR